MAVTPSLPASVKPGQSGNGTLEIKWLNTGINAGNANIISNIMITPACGAFISPCGASVDPGVITLNALGNGVGQCGTATGVGTFTLTEVPPGGGNWTVVPVGGSFMLPVNGTCTIQFGFNVVAPATKDADPVLSGKQTAFIAGASAADAFNGNLGTGLGTAEISFPTIVTTPGAGGTLTAAPVNLSDSAIVSALVPDVNNNPPTGTVTFSLFAPSDASCVGAPFQSQVVNLTSCVISPTTFLTTCATSNTFPANAAGTWHWTAVYSGNADNQSVSSPCASEPVVVNPANPTIVTVPTPAAGTRLVTVLSDSATLAGGFAPTGTITFTLYPPSDSTCAAAAIFTSVVPVAGNGTYPSASAPASLITTTGTYHWKAVYSGDANNVGVTSPCALEPVGIDQPVLSIAKTPDNGTITAGDTATFTIVVTNLGPGAATGVVIDDTLPTGGGITWTTATPNCTVTLNVLHCNVPGNLAANASFTAVATAVTSFGKCTVMNNTATASASNAGTVTDTGLITCVTPVLQIAKTPDGGTITAGDTATFTIVVTNLGPGAATGVVIDDTLPAGGGVTWTTATPNCTVTLNVLHCNVPGSLAANASFTAVVTAVTSLGRCTVMNNTATASASNAGTVSDTGLITCVTPVLQIAKTPDNGTVIAGATATYTIVLTNLGPGTAVGVAIDDPLPAGGGVTWTTATPNCAVTTNVLHCTVGSLA
ncbi:MAG: DUF11 domain-containing protein, partial [Vicinamibacterales bacterium]